MPNYSAQKDQKNSFGAIGVDSPPGFAAHGVHLALSLRDLLLHRLWHHTVPGLVPRLCTGICMASVLPLTIISCRFMSREGLSLVAHQCCQASAAVLYGQPTDQQGIGLTRCVEGRVRHAPVPLAETGATQKQDPSVRVPIRADSEGGNTCLQRTRGRARCRSGRRGSGRPAAPAAQACGRRALCGRCHRSAPAAPLQAHMRCASPAVKWLPVSLLPSSALGQGAPAALLKQYLSQTVMQLYAQACVPYSLLQLETGT